MSSYLSGYINEANFFRICHAILQNTNEDLQYLAQNISKGEVEYSLEVQDLLSSGLLFQKIMHEKQDPKYSFSLLAMYVDKYAVSCKDIDKYPNPEINPAFEIPRIDLKTFATFQ